MKDLNNSILNVNISYYDEAKANHFLDCLIIRQCIGRFLILSLKGGGNFYMEQMFFLLKFLMKFKILKTILFEKIKQF